MVLCPPCAVPAYTHGAARDLGLLGSYSVLANLLGFPAGVVPVTRVLADEEAGGAASRDMVVRRGEQGRTKQRGAADRRAAHRTAVAGRHRTRRDAGDRDGSARARRLSANAGRRPSNEERGSARRRFQAVSTPRMVTSPTERASVACYMSSDGCRYHRHEAHRCGSCGFGLACGLWGRRRHVGRTAAAGREQRQHAARPSSSTPHAIKHVVIIFQENRTVDNLFNGLPGRGYGADRVSTRAASGPTAAD